MIKHTRIKHGNVMCPQQWDIVIAGKMNIFVSHAENT